MDSYEETIGRLDERIKGKQLLRNFAAELSDALRQYRRHLRLQFRYASVDGAEWWARFTQGDIIATAESPQGCEVAIPFRVDFDSEAMQVDLKWCRSSDASHPCLLSSDLIRRMGFRMESRKRRPMPVLELVASDQHEEDAAILSDYVDRCGKLGPVETGEKWSYAEVFILAHLRKHDQSDAWEPWCKRHGLGLEYDIANVDEGILIEYHGGYWHSTQWVQKRDMENKEKALAKSFSLIWVHENGLFEYPKPPNYSKMKIHESRLDKALLDIRQSKTTFIELGSYD